MTRVCCYCQAEMGEKCGKCGSLDVRTWFSLLWAEIDIWICQGCSHFWVGGADGKTDGICPPCYEREVAALGPREAA